MKDKTGIVIVNYNTSDEVIACVESIRKYVKVPYTIYVVDNASKVEIRNQLESVFKELKNIRMVFLTENLGYSGGNNAGIRVALHDQCKYIAIVNSDIELKNDAISLMIEDLSEQIKVVGPKVITLDNTDGQCLIKPYNYKRALFDRQPFYTLKRLLKIGIINPRNITKKTIFNGMVSGCFFLIDGAAFVKIGLFDENVFLYSEERIMSIKLEQNGYKTCYDPNALVLHKEGCSTSKKGSAFADYHRYISDYYTVVRYCKIAKIEQIFFRELRKVSFCLKRINGKEYILQYKRLKEKMKEIENGEYKINP